MMRVRDLSKYVNGRGGAVVRIVVAGDSRTGKTSLVLAAGAFKIQVKLDLCFGGVPITIIDTSSRVEDSDRVSEELQRADSVILTYACDRPNTLQNISTFWLPLLRKLEVKVPVIVVGCKLDLLDENQYVRVEPMMSPLMQKFCEIESSLMQKFGEIESSLMQKFNEIESSLMQKFCEIESCIECSAYRNTEVTGVFFLALKAALYPVAPLFDKESKTLTPRCKRALKRIFILCDHDKDGALSHCELDGFQVQCFDSHLLPREFFVIKKVVKENLSEGVNERGLTLPGFLLLHALFFEKGTPEKTWTVLRKFGYIDDIKLADDFILHFIRAPDQSVELTNEATDYLKTIFDEFDRDFDKVLQPHELEELFSTVPKSPWIENPYKDAVERNEFGGLSLDAFLSEWALMTLLNPTFSVENLIYIGYPGDPSSAIRVTRGRHVDRQKQHSERNVLQCFIFGPMKAGKSALLNSFIGRPHSEAHNPTNEDHYAVNVVDMSRENKKYLVLREISDGGVSKLLANKESLVSCDIAVFVYDRSDESSWKASFELLLKIAGHGQDTGYQVPCLIVEAKDDHDSFTMAIQEATMVSKDMGRKDMGVESPMPISVKFGDFNNVYRQIVTAAEHPHLSILNNEAGKTHKQYMGVETPVPISEKLGAVNNIFRRIVTAAEHLHLSITKIRKQYPPSMFVGGLAVVVSIGITVAENCSNWNNGC